MANCSLVYLNPTVQETAVIHGTTLHHVQEQRRNPTLEWMKRPSKSRILVKTHVGLLLMGSQPPTGIERLSCELFPHVSLAEHWAYGKSQMLTLRISRPVWPHSTSTYTMKIWLSITQIVWPGMISAAYHITNDVPPLVDGRRIRMGWKLVCFAAGQWK